MKPATESQKKKKYRKTTHTRTHSRSDTNRTPNTPQFEPVWWRRGVVAAGVERNDSHTSNESKKKCASERETGFWALEFFFAYL